jgi:hypothetical protein
MADLHELGFWLGTFETSVAVAVALPVILARVLASLANRVERYLVSRLEQAPPDDPGVASRFGLCSAVQLNTPSLSQRSSRKLAA